MNLIKLVEEALLKSKKNISNADPEIANIPGMSTPEFRHFLNNLCSVPGTKYLEIGTWQGSTLCGAISNNPQLTAYAIDNFSEFGCPRSELHKNLERYDTYNRCTFIDGDCFAIDKSLIKHPIDIYLYDGCHKQEDHVKALTEFIDKMNETFIFIVDDYNWQMVQDGTQEAIKSLNCKIEKEWTFLTPANFSPVWHNGCYIAILSKA